MENKIKLRSCLEEMAKIDSASFDLVLADPPYKQEAHGRGLATKRKIYSEMAKYTSLDNDWYCESILAEYCRVCKYPNVFLFGGKRDVFPILRFCEERKLFYNILPVCKKTPTPFVNNTWLSNEYAVHFADRKITKCKGYQAKIPYFLAGNEKETNHPNEKALRDIERIVLNLTDRGERVFDPFSGSGSVSVACKRLGRDSLACEVDESYFRDSLDRLERTKEMNLKEYEVYYKLITQGNGQGSLF